MPQQLANTLSLPNMACSGCAAAQGLTIVPSNSVIH